AQRYLPWFRVANAEASAVITVRQLLNHTSGLAVGAGRDQEHDTLEGHVRGLSEVTLVHAPGERHEYSSANYLVLGHIVEVLSGQSFGAYVEEHIFAPLDMKHSFASQEAAQETGVMASGYQYWLSYPRATTLSHESDRLPTAALIASAEDMAHFMIAQLDEGRYQETAVLSPESMAEMHRPTAESEGFSYAMGWRVSETEGVAEIFHGGIVPNFRGQMVMLPGLETGVVVLTNVSSVMGTPTSHRMAATVAALLGDTPPPAHSNMTLTLLHGFIAFGVLMITFNQIKDLVRVRRWAEKLPRPPFSTPMLLRKIVLPIALEILIPLLLLFGLPRWLGFSWAEMIRQMPDIAYWLMLASALGLLIAFLKGRLALSVFNSGEIA
nr:beta-lactamase family protein [Ardenticatenales bacterium]